MGVARTPLQEVLLEKGEDVWRDQMCAIREFPVDARVKVSGVGLCVAKVLRVPDPIYSLRATARSCLKG